MAFTKKQIETRLYKICSHLLNRASRSCVQYKKYKKVDGGGYWFGNMCGFSESHHQLWKLLQDIEKSN